MNARPLRALFLALAFTAGSMCLWATTSGSRASKPPGAPASISTHAYATGTNVPSQIVRRLHSIAPHAHIAALDKFHLIIARGSDADQAVLKAAVAAMAAGVTPEPEATTYDLKNAIPSMAGGSVTSSAAALVEAVRAAVVKSFPGVQLGLDPGSNVIVISGDVAGVKRAWNVLRSMDATPTEVELDVGIYAFDTSSTKDVGLSLPTNSVTTTVSEFYPNASGTTAPQIGVLKNVGKVLRSPLSLLVQLNLLMSEGSGYGIAFPKIRVLSGRTAQLNATDSIPFVNFVAAPGATALAGSSGTATTGLQLTAVPFAPNGSLPNMHIPITLYLHPSFGTLVGETPQGAPEVATRETFTTLQVPEGDAVVIAGLQDWTTSNSEDYAPPFKHIPFLKHLFGSSAGSENRTELYVVILPRIVGTPNGHAADMDGLDDLFNFAFPGESFPSGIYSTPSPPVTPTPTPTR
jgi:Flp pilus assembly secretin CpaC